MSPNLVKLVILFVISTIIECKANPFFRKDYTYLPDTDSFYKVHTILKNFRDGRKQCINEGAKMFYPEDTNEANAVIAYWNKTQPNIPWIYIGVSALHVQGVFETDDGIPIDEVFNRWDPGEPNNWNGEECVTLRIGGYLNDFNCISNFSFICKKTEGSLEWNALCDLPDKDYLYSSVTGKCYKFHSEPATWTEAYSICSAEQSYLAVINNQAEANELVHLTKKGHRDNIRNKKFLNGVVFLGFNVKDDDEWHTIKGLTLSETGYSKWGNKQAGGSEHNCGSMTYDGLLNDAPCNAKAFYMCEHDVATLGNSINDRFKPGH